MYWKWWWMAPVLIFVGIVGPGLLVRLTQPTSQFATFEEAVCSALMDQPTRAGVDDVLRNAQDLGLRDPRATVFADVTHGCPQFAPLFSPAEIFA